MTHKLTPQDLHDYQKECVMHQLRHPDSMLWLQMGLGKEQPDTEPVLTPEGWRPIGDISIGERVIGSNGKPTRVHGVYPQGEKEVVTVTFSDDTFTRCGWDHLWRVYSEHQRFKGLPGTVYSLRDLVKKGLTKKAGKNGISLKWSIPLVSPVVYPPQLLEIDPYTLGVILGDGHISEKSGIMGKRSWEKHVPEHYLRSPVDDRLALLQGLLDTDGSPIAKGGVEFSSTSENLIDSVIDLTQSLGGVAKNKTERVTTYQGGKGRVSWRVNVKLPCNFTPFRLQRKIDRWVRPTKYQPMRKIKSIEVTGSELSRCISVDAADCLYVTRNHVLTHNTPITLTTIVDRMRASQVEKTLIFGPLRVIQAVWAREARKWTHTKHLRFSVIHGNPEQRLRALFANADVFLINYENMNWMASQLVHYYTSQDKPLPFQMVVYDEVSKLKKSTTLRMAGGKRDRVDKQGKEYKIHVTGWRKLIDKFKYRTGLTGTPASNGYLDLHGQYLAVDGGERLGAFITRFKDSYFMSNHNGWGVTPTELGKQFIEQKIFDITKKMDAADYLDLPDSTVVNMLVDLPPKARKGYVEVEKQMFTQLDTGTEIEVFSKSSISNKCLQFCNGSPYLSAVSDEYEALHDAKLNALEEVLEEAAGAPVLCSYSFKADAERIMRKFKALRPVNLTASKSSDTERIIDEWNSGKIKLMIGHPASMGHGVDGLQESGSIIVWFGVNWSLELYEQMNGRLDRQGQINSVSIIRILCRDTVDLAVVDALDRKTDDQNGLKAAIQRYRSGYTTNNLEMNFM